MAGAGRPLEWMRPLRPDGSKHAPDVAVGCYNAHYDHWNIRNPVPGFTYRIVRTDRVGYCQRLGYEVCDTPEKGAFGATYSPHLQGQGSDRVQRDQNMILMRIPTPLLAKRREEKTAKAKAQLTGTPFLQTSRPGEEGGTEDRPIRFKMPNHGIQPK